MSRFRFIEDGLCCDVDFNKKTDNGKCALFLYGFPASISSNLLTDFLVEKGYTVLQPHYYGTYDSEGDFTPESAVATVKKMFEIVSRKKVRNLKENVVYFLPNEISICIGYSFGAYVIRNAIEYLRDVKTVILVSPVMSNNPGNPVCWVNENGDEHLHYVLRTRPFTYRIKNKQSWMANYVNDNELVNHSVTNNIRDVIWLYGCSDPAMIEEKLVTQYNLATRSCISEGADIHINAVFNGEHSINSLITDEVKTALSHIIECRA